MISCCSEEVVAFFLAEEVADMAGRLPELIIGSCCGFSDQGLELGECHFDRVAVRAEGGKEQEPGTDAFKHRRCLSAFVACEIVEKDAIAASQGRGQLGFDAEIEVVPVYRPVAEPFD